MIRQILVLDKEGELAGHIAKIFSGFIRGYQVFHAKSPEEAIEIAKKQMIDVVAINGNDFHKSFSAGTMQMLKQKIFPMPKLLLLLEPNLLDTLPSLEGNVDHVLNSTDFSTLKFERIVNDLVHKKYTEEYQRGIQEVANKKYQEEAADRRFDEICRELEKKVKGSSGNSRDEEK